MIRPAQSPRVSRLDDIMQAVMALTGCEEHHLLGGSKVHRFTAARAMFVQAARRLTSMSFPEIAMRMGRVQHTTAFTLASYPVDPWSVECVLILEASIRGRRKREQLENWRLEAALSRLPKIEPKRARAGRERVDCHG